MPPDARLFSATPRTRLWWLAVVLLVGLAHVRSLGNGFVFDDIPIVVDNPAIGDPTMWREWLRGFWPGHDLYFRPLTLASLALDHRVGGGHPFLFHLTNVILHVLGACVLGSIARRLGFGVAGAIAAALAFGLHPIVTEPVNWISARGDLLATAAILAAVRLSLSPHHHCGQRFAVAGLLLAAMCAKESAVVGPVLLLLADATHPPTPRARRLARLAPAVVALAGYLALRAVSLGSLLPTTEAPSALHNPLVTSDLATRLRWPMAAVGESVRRLVWPRPLSSDYSFAAMEPPSSWATPTLWLGLVTLVIAAAVVVRRVRSSPTGPSRAWLPIVAAGVAWLPTSNVFILHGSIFGERFLYLPWAALALLAAPLGVRAAHVVWTGTERGPTRMAARGLALTAVGAVVLLAGAACIHRAGDWHDDRTLFASAASAHPRNAQAIYNVGTLHLQAAAALSGDDPRRLRELVDALAAFRRARTIYPAYMIAHVNEGVGLYELGRWDEADTAFAAAARLDPEDPRPPFNRGRVAEARGDDDAAAEHYRRSVDLAGGGPAADALRRIESRSGEPSSTR